MQKKNIIAYLIITLFAFSGNMLRLNLGIHWGSYLFPILLILLPATIDSSFIPANFIRFTKEGARQFLFLQIVIFLLFPILFFFYFTLAHEISFINDTLSAVNLKVPAYKIVFPSNIKLFSKILKSLILTFIVAFPEEFFFRGFLQQHTFKSFNQRIFLFITKRNIIVSALFGLSHAVALLNPLAIITFFPSLIFGYIAEKSNSSIVYSTVAHTLSNMISGVLFMFLL